MKTLSDTITNDEVIDISDYSTYTDPDRTNNKVLITTKTCKICNNVSFHVLTKEFNICDKCGFIQ